MLGIVEAKGLRKVLVDTREQTSLQSVLVLCEFGARLFGLTGDLKHAILASGHSLKDLPVVATISRHRGAQMDFFDCPKAALAWLNE